MIKIQKSKRTAKLADVLEKIIADYQPPGRQMGAPNPHPKITEEDLNAIKQSKKDIQIAIPDVDAYFIDKKNHEKEFFDAAQGLFPKSKLISISGRFHYPPHGFMGWHTNSNAEGIRVYATKVPEDGKSFFRYCQEKVITEWEKAGWNFRAFEVKQAAPYWHCVYTDVDRYSFGLRFESKK
jgi:hypothetical protein